VRRIDHVFLSHAHADHINGVGDVFGRFKVGTVYVPQDFAEYPGGRHVLDLAGRYGVSVKTVRDGYVLNLGDEATGRVFCLPHESAGSGPRDANKGSLALRLEYQGHRFLLCGDNDAESLRHILSNGTAYDAVLVPHHGSWATGGEGFFETVNARWAFLSASSTFPNRQARDVLESRDIALECTDTAGALTLEADGGTLCVSRFLEKRTGSRE